ncbi:MAG TPA: hypothetical protein VMS55_10210 [Myxococcota bacterium]|nr:hypothetical protein [Myxococcota bacterium]
MNALSYLAFLVPILLSPHDISGPEQYLPFVVNAIAGATLIGFREPLASSLFRVSTNASIEIAAVEELQSFLLALLGLWFLVEATAAAFQVETSLNIHFSQLSESEFAGDRLAFLLSGDAWGKRFPYVVRLAAGLVLFFNSGNVVRAWQKARRAGRAPSELAG